MTHVEASPAALHRSAVRHCHSHSEDLVAVLGSLKFLLDVLISLLIKVVLSPLNLLSDLRRLVAWLVVICKVFDEQFVTDSVIKLDIRD